MKKLLMLCLLPLFSTPVMASSINFQSIVDATSSGLWGSFRDIPLKWQTQKCHLEGGFVLCSETDIPNVGKGEISVSGTRGFTENTSIYMNWHYDSFDMPAYLLPFEDNAKYIQKLLPKYTVSELKVDCESYGASFGRTAYLLKQNDNNILMLVESGSGSAGGTVEILLSSTEVGDKKAVYKCESDSLTGELVLP